MSASRPGSGSGAEPGGRSVHPIEAESYRRIADRIDLSHLPNGEKAIVERVLHATADLGFAASLRFTPGAVRAGVSALGAGAPVVVDVEMVRAGVSRPGAECYLEDARQLRASRHPAADAAEQQTETTLSALAMKLAAGRHPDGGIFVIGCAPTALEQLLDLVADGGLRPALVVGVPVGYVGAAEAKERLASFAQVESISNLGERGGSAVAAAIVNALSRLEGSTRPPET